MIEKNVLVGLLALPALLASPVAQADELDSFNLRASLSILRDDNTFRLADGATPSLPTTSPERGDTITSTSVGLNFDKRWSLQRLRLDASLTEHRYSNHDFLDYRADNANARWEWGLTPHLTGHIGGGRSQSLNNFVDYRRFDRNINTADQIDGAIEYGGLGPWRLFAGADKVRNTNSLVFRETGDTDAKGGEAGIKYLTRAGSSFGFRLRERRIDWLHRSLNDVYAYDTSAREHRQEVLFGLKPFDKTEIDGFVGHVKRRHDHFAIRDYDGTDGQLTARWLPTAKLQFDVQARRNHDSWWDLFSSHTVTDSLSIGPAWQIDSKFTLRGRYEQSERSFSGTPLVMSLDPQRQDRISSASLNLDWQPWRLLGLSLSLSKTRRSSNLPGYEFDDLTAGVTVNASY